MSLTKFNAAGEIVRVVAADFEGKPWGGGSAPNKVKADRKGEKPPGLECLPIGYGTAPTVFNTDIRPALIKACKFSYHPAGQTRPYRDPSDRMHRLTMLVVGGPFLQTMWRHGGERTTYRLNEPGDYLWFDEPAACHQWEAVNTANMLTFDLIEPLAEKDRILLEQIQNSVKASS